MLLVVLLLVTACSSSQSSGSQASDQKASKAQAGTRQDKNTLTIGLDDDPPQMDPHKSTAAVDRQVYQSIYNKLIDINEKMEFVPELATKWSVSDDGQTYTFNLRKNVLFHDGTPFNAEAVKFNFERMLDPKFGSPRLSEINLIDHIKVVDDHTIQIHLKKPYAPFLSVLTDRAGMMVSPTAVKKEGKDFANHPVGTGPYKFVKRVKQGYIKVTRFDKYWGPKPKIKTIVYKPYPDGNVRVTNLVSGSVDLVNKIDYKDINRLKSNAAINVVKTDALGFQGIMLNTQVAPFNNKKVRQALNWAIDRKAIAKVVYHNGVTPAVNAFPKSSWAHPDDMKVPDANIKKAKALIQASGLSNIHFTLKITPKPEEKQVGQMLQAMLSQVGIKVKLEMVEFGTLLQQMESHDFQAIRIGWSGRVDPDGNAYSWFTSKGSLNDMGYANPKVDQLLAKARTISDQGQRKDIYEQVSKIIWEDAPYIFLFYPNDFKAMKKDVGGFKKIPDTMIRSRSLYFK